MKLKLTKSEFDALLAIFSIFDHEGVPEGMQAKLLYLLLLKIYDRLMIKSIRRKMTVRYDLKLSQEEALAWWVFFERHPMDRYDIYSRNLINKISNRIHQNFA